MKLTSLVLAAVLTACVMGIADAGYRRVCYYTSRSNVRPGVGQFTPNDIDASLCTHIIFAFAQIKSHKLTQHYENDTELYSEVTDLKLQNPDLKVLLAVGWGTAGRKAFSRTVSRSSRIKTFANSTVSYLRLYNFDGLELNWDYPTIGNGSHPEKEHFGELIMELRRVFEEESVSSGSEQLMLTSAVSAVKATIDAAYNGTIMAENLDFVSIMSYDLHDGNTENHTDHHSLLMARHGAVGDDQYLSMAWAVDYWRGLGVASQQINIGLATYGRGFTLSNNTLSGIEANATGPSKAGQYTEAEGFLAYYEMCDLMAAGGQSYRNYGSPYFVDADQWIGYDDEESLHWKVVWLVKENLGGAMLFSLDLDDFRGSCKSPMGTFPLTRTVKDKLLAAENGTLPLPTNFYCGGKPDGLYAYEGSCMGFGMCADGHESWVDCPDDLMFDKNILTCVSKEAVNCLE